MSKVKHSDLRLQVQEVLHERGAVQDEYERKDVVKELCGWHIGHSSWFGVFENWLHNAGLEIKEIEQ